MALCAPARACLLAGRNAHAVGVGNIAEWGRDHPGYKGWIREDAPISRDYKPPFVLQGLEKVVIDLEM